VDQGHIERTLLRVRLLLTRSAVHRMGLRTKTLNAITLHFFTNATLSLSAHCTV